MDQASSKSMFSSSTYQGTPRKVQLSAARSPHGRRKTYEDAHKLRNSERGVSVIELDGNEVRDLAEWFLKLLESAENVEERGGGPEVLLLEAELLSGVLYMRDVGAVSDPDGR